MELIYVIIGMALLEFSVFGLLVGGQRVKQKVEAPATSGNEPWPGPTTATCTRSSTIWSHCSGTATKTDAERPPLQAKSGF